MMSADTSRTNVSVLVSRVQSRFVCGFVVYFEL